MTNAGPLRQVWTRSEPISARFIAHVHLSLCLSLYIVYVYLYVTMSVHHCVCRVPACRPWPAPPQTVRRGAENRPLRPIACGSRAVSLPGPLAPRRR